MPTFGAATKAAKSACFRLSSLSGINEPELDAIERYMSDILDEVLAQSSGATKHATEE